MSTNTRRIHLEGFGLQGALIAHELALKGIDFTWHDTDAEHVAWKASTGAIYPSGSTKFGPDMPCHHEWYNKHLSGEYGAHLTRAHYVFCTKRPPHEGNYSFTETVHGIKVGETPSFHFNAQTFVNEMRRKYEERRGACQPGSILIIAHGFSDRSSHAYWGWTVPVKLTYNKSMYGETTAFYFRPDRVQMAYAYPIAGTPFHYAGSSIIKQRLGKFHSLEIAPKYETWKQRMFKFSNGAIDAIDPVGDPVEGWRPAVAEGDDAWARIRGRVIITRPLWNNGIRHFPMQWMSLLGALKQVGVL